MLKDTATQEQSNIVEECRTNFDAWIVSHLPHKTLQTEREIAESNQLRHIYSGMYLDPTYRGLLQSVNELPIDNLMLTINQFLSDHEISERVNWGIQDTAETILHVLGLDDKTGLDSLGIRIMSKLKPDVQRQLAQIMGEDLDRADYSRYTK